MFVIGSTAKVFLDGLEILSGSVKISTKGSATTKKVFGVVLGGPATAETSISLNTPVFAASPLDVQQVAQELTQRAGIMTIVDVVNSTTRTANVMVSDKDESFDPEKAAEQDWELVVLGKMMQV